MVVLDHLEALHLGLAVPVASVVSFQIPQGPSGALFEHLVGAITDGIQQPFGLAKFIDLRHRQAAIAAQQDEHLRPRRPQGLDDAAQRRDHAATGVDGPRSQPGRQRKTALPIEDQQREILVLIEVAMKEAQNLLAMRRIIGGIHIEDDGLGGRPPRADE